jgi:hypothetical protein
MELAFSFLIIILTSTICWLISSVYVQLIAKRYSKKIMQSTSAIESCGYRKTYKILLLGDRVLYLILAYIGTICIFELIIQDFLHLPTPGTAPKYIYSGYFWMLYGIVVLYYKILILTNTSYTPFDVVTSATKNDVKKDYVLFLRGFGMDNYLSLNYQENNKQKDFFSEHKFMRRLSFLFESYAIGRPEELKNPSGAIRIYLDDASWQLDVKELMQNARCVIILVNDKPNCIWEIAQAIAIHKKVVYIVNNKQKYLNVCQQLPQFNLLGQTPTAEHFYMYYDNSGALSYKPFTNTGDSYWTIINTIKDICSR